MKVTDAMVEAGAVAAFFRNAQPVTAESIDRFRQSDAFETWRATSRAALEAAFSAAEPVRDDAAPAPTDVFTEAMEWFGECAYELGKADHFQNNILQGRWEDRIEEAEANVLALHRQAWMAGIREIRETIYQESETCNRRSEFEQGYGDGVDWALDKIDAMLQEATVSDPRDVIARVSYAAHPRRTQPYGGGDPIPWEQLGGRAKELGGYEIADAILDALDAAGYEIVKREQPLPTTPGPFNPFGEQD